LEYELDKSRRLTWQGRLAPICKASITTPKTYFPFPLRKK
jgi:hypothetical protein